MDNRIRLIPTQNTIQQPVAVSVARSLGQTIQHQMRPMTVMSEGQHQAVLVPLDLARTVPSSQHHATVDLSIVEGDHQQFWTNIGGNHHQAVIVAQTPVDLAPVISQQQHHHHHDHGSLTRIVNVADISPENITRVSHVEVAKMEQSRIVESSKIHIPEVPMTKHIIHPRMSVPTNQVPKLDNDLSKLTARLQMPNQKLSLENGQYHHARDELIQIPLQDNSKLVGLSDVMTRVIHMSDISNRLAVPEMRIVIQDDVKTDIDQLHQTNLSHENIIDGLHKQTSQNIQQQHQQQPIVNHKQVLQSVVQQAPQAIPEIQQQVITTRASHPTVIELAAMGSMIPDVMDIHPEPMDMMGDDDTPLNRVANLTHPAQVIEEIGVQYKTASQYDAIWKCNGGKYKVHKLVLGLSSPLLKQILLEQNDEVKPVICTPDFSSAIVKSILCLFYTGKVNVARDILGEVNIALKLLGFIGDNVSVLPNQEIIKQEILQPDYDPGSYLEVEMMNKERGASKRVKEEVLADSDEEWDPRNLDSAFDTGIQGSSSEEDDDYLPALPRYKRKIKSENWSDDDDEEEVKHHTGFKRGRKSLKTPDTYESFRTRGPGKGERSYQLAADLFDGKHVDFIYVCHCCYKIFDTEKKLSLHKDDVHPSDQDANGESHTENPHEYTCLKCNEIIPVKHIAWFCKHVKYCRENNEMAKAIVGPDDDGSDADENGGGHIKRKYNKKKENLTAGGATGKDTADRLRVTGEGKGKNVRTMSKLLLGKIVDWIYACKLCYQAYDTEEELEHHKMETHKEDETVGKYWNANSDNYTCPFCEQVQNSRHLVWFIYHMRKCNMGNANVMQIPKKIKNEEEDTDEDEEPETTDPEGIIFKTYKIKGERADWICQALLGRHVDRIYPCHVCYSVFTSDNDLRQHFRSSHQGVFGNRARHGPYFDKTENLYNCPVCLKQVCKNQINTIFFTYHYRKCANQTFPMQKPCPDCGKEFTLYPSYKQHLDAHTEARNFMCHICTKAFPSNARLNYHVQYVHSSYKPFQCSKCTKSYKRKAELLEHEEMSHSINYNYSCEKCGKQFFGKKNLALHMKTHYTEDEKKHVCNICGYRFAKIKFLKNHLTTHSDVRQFACEVCGARVKTRDTLKQHRKKLHNLLTPVPRSQITH